MLVSGRVPNTVLLSYVGWELTPVVAGPQVPKNSGKPKIIEPRTWISFDFYLATYTVINTYTILYLSTFVVSTHLYKNIRQVGSFSQFLSKNKKQQFVFGGFNPSEKF